ncbi:hypothetical protein [Flavobacterium gawalongense]|uniref:Uncharacterized protein n=1 Tax=Flavobacterium gawalongense TaxID=2594432 RepID=A0A553BQQ0_9FLAO|nr:hypothetical protein [Flavobacterium gawalongense]TRX10555.1 hypothetical protein FNW11_07480 [Flavobacterium gawalongense]TRX11687.1 hypothetical protein FNW10_06080 [Flavobacterium gawalongense]TRX29479.1 hypothetical protein FNW38_06175 [Flavobacterium gawalongense]
MKIQENYFYKLDNSKEVKVIWKKYDKACILEIGIDYPTAIVDIDRLTGIELTEKHLENLGFKKEDDAFWLKLNESWQYLELNHNADDTDNLFVGYITTEQIEKNKIDPIFLNHINFIHEIQSLFYSLRGNDLVFSYAVL